MGFGYLLYKGAAKAPTRLRISSEPFCAHTQEWDIDEDADINIIGPLAQIDSCTYMVIEWLWICDLYSNRMRWAMHLFSCLEASET